ncbi:OMP85 family outer membrane protein [Hyphomonas johnsonii MHS-2]|uniref:OMP85 family outer membrane protein n=1 Tax=Hyphomonas johnsonii MHS-2 TaxID=1280950 RepID=A0A059FU63_9PROT|nr:OMP85 family outer membrane protein [Hyphomonas johnsonii MHS-2]
MSACSIIPGGKSISAGTNGRQVPVVFDGLPQGLSGKANSALATDDAPPRSVLEARQRAGSAADTLEELLASEGYLAATVAPEMIESVDMRPRLDVSAGEMFRVTTVQMTVTGDLDDTVRADLETALKTIAPGAPARTSDIEALGDNLISKLKAGGYAFAESPAIDVLASRQDKTVELTYALQPGAFVRLGDMVGADPAFLDQKAINALQTWKRGDTYSPEKIDQLRTRLRSTGLYNAIGVEISRTPDADGFYPVTLTLAQGKLRSVGAGVTASTTDGVGADAFWERRNVTGAGDTIRIQSEVATIARNLTARYTRPNIGRFGRTFTAEAGVRDEETDAYDLQGVKVGASLSQPLNKNLTVSAGATLDATRIDELSLRSGIDARDQLTLSFPLTAIYSTVKQPLDPQAGNRAFVGVEPGVSVGDNTVGYTRILLTGSTYHKIADGPFVAAVRAELGAFVGSNSVPADRLFFAGGGGSVRGFEYQSLSPRDLNGDLIGGRSLFDLSTELRWRRSAKHGYVLFVDTGAAADSVDETFSDLRSSIGVGFRYYPGFGPIRIDIATPLDRRDGEDPVHFYISIGQSF